MGCINIYNNNIKLTLISKIRQTLFLNKLNFDSDVLKIKKIEGTLVYNIFIDYCFYFLSKLRFFHIQF